MFKDVEHLVRLIAVMVFAFVGFLGVRAALVPKTFGEFGHYRGAALGELASRPIAYAGRQSCENCHSDVVELTKQGKHVVIACETCHGPQSKHVEDPGNFVPAKVEITPLCAHCHEANSAKPKNFPQVAAADHSAGLTCDTCHQPHRPKIDSGSAK